MGKRLSPASCKGQLPGMPDVMMVWIRLYDDESVRKMIERVTVVDAETIRVKFRYGDWEIEQTVC